MGTEAGASETKPPLFSKGDYVEAGDGWWAHRGGQWLHNPADKAYFHLPTGQIQLAPPDEEEGSEAAGSAAAETVAAAAEAPSTEAAAATKRPLEEVPERLTGTVRWYNPRKGFGFIAPEGADLSDIKDGADHKKANKAQRGKDIFFHRKQLLDQDQAEELEAGVAVLYTLGQLDDGRSCAVGIELVVEEAPPAKRARRGETDGDEEMEEGDDEAADSDEESVEVDVFDELITGLAAEKGPTKDVIEDYSVNKMKLPISVLGEDATCVFFAVFDGHGGSSCAEYCASHLAKNILSRLRDKQKTSGDEAFLKAGLLSGFKQTEHNFLQHAKRMEDRAGTTACTMLVYGPDEESRLRLYMANVGDSRAVVGRVGGGAIRLTQDHKPNLPDERKRIEAAGGGVAEIGSVWRCMLPRNRISPIVGLAVSRAIGDKDFKNPDIVSAEPEITIHDVDWDDDEFVILASDGIWDVISDKEAVRIVQQTFKDGGNEDKAAENLVAKALEKGTHDDRTALVVRFGWCKGSAAFGRGKEEPPAAEVAADVVADAEGGQAVAAASVGAPAAEAVPTAEEDDEENDPEVEAAIRAAMGYDDDDDDDDKEGEEEDVEMAADGEVEAEPGETKVGESSVGGSSSSSAAAPSAAAAASAPAAAGPSSEPPSATATSSASSSSATTTTTTTATGTAASSSTAAATTAASSSSSTKAAGKDEEPPEPQGLGAVAQYFGIEAGDDDDEDEEEDSDEEAEYAKMKAAAEEFFGLSAGQGAGLGLGLDLGLSGGGEKPGGAAAAEAAAAEVDLDDIFAGGMDDDKEEKTEGSGVSSFASFASASGSKAVGMGLFDMDLPAPAEELGPALVGPRGPQ